MAVFVADTPDPARIAALNNFISQVVEGPKLFVSEQNKKFSNKITFLYDK